MMRPRGTRHRRNLLNVNYVSNDEVREVLNRIDHPVIDSDGHLIEYTPLVRDFIAEDAGADIAAQFEKATHTAARRAAVPSPAERRDLGIFSTAVWGLPARKHPRPRNGDASGPHVPASR